eukprot:TRINITY_DN5191_c0_g1_i6.p1 TRINITY_DN5191_c0_g1~~TRINITY_DN5191_c0_g1_i6.p1  ORF type:complete len:554 (-),score=115.66 TRINITY_DN5191_c0_g1_i6:1578-3176(-)
MSASPALRRRPGTAATEDDSSDPAVAPATAEQQEEYRSPLLTAVMGPEPTILRILVALGILAAAVATRNWLGFKAAMDAAQSGAPAMPAMQAALKQLLPASAQAHAQFTSPDNWLSSVPSSLPSQDSDENGFNSGNSSSEKYKKNMLWGTYMPGLYFGFRTRTVPAALSGGILWGSADTPLSAFRHEAADNDGVESYGWDMHDGRSFGKQTIKDPQNGVTLVTSMVKPMAMEQIPEGAGGTQFATRIQLLPNGASEGTPPKVSLYLYFGIDCDGALPAEGGMCLAAAGSNGLQARRIHEGDRQWEMTGHMDGVGDLAADIACGSDNVTGSGITECKAFAMSDVTFSDVRQHIMLHTRSHAWEMEGGWEMNGESFEVLDAGARGNVVGVKITASAPACIDLVIRDAAAAPTSTAALSHWLQTAEAAVDERFAQTFTVTPVPALAGAGAGLPSHGSVSQVADERAAADEEPGVCQERGDCAAIDLSAEGQDGGADFGRGGAPSRASSVHTTGCDCRQPAITVPGGTGTAVTRSQ